MTCNVDQLNIHHDLQVNFTNLAENEFNFIEDFFGVGYSQYFNLDQVVALDVLVKELWRFANTNKDGEVPSAALGLPIQITQ